MPPAASFVFDGRKYPAELVYKAHRLGEGGYGEAYLVKLPRIGMVVMKKSLKKGKECQVLMNEIQVMEALGCENPNIVCFLGSFVLGGDRYLVSNYIAHSETVDRWVRCLNKFRDGDLEHSYLIPIALVLARTIKYMHRKGVVHRDIDPSNILVVGKIPYVIDLGLARDRDHLPAPYAGKVGYMAPEFLKGCVGKIVTEHNFEEWVQGDIYSFGLVLYFIFAGHHAYEDAIRDSTVDGQPEDIYVSIITARNEAKWDFSTHSTKIKKLIGKMVGLNPSSRPGWSEIIKTLEGI